MQIIARRMFFLIAVFAAVPALAGKVGFLDTDRAIKTVKEGQRQMMLLNDWSNQKADEVESIRDRVTELTRQLNSQRSVATEDAIKKLEQDLLSAQRELEDAARALQRDFEAKRREMLAQVVTRIRDLTGEYAKANGFDAILMFESTQLVYVDDAAIITDAVIQLYNQRYPVN